MAGPVSLCTVKGCGTRVHGQGLCLKHYKRWRRHGDVAAVKKPARGPEVCSVEGCGRGDRIRRGLCTLHYQRWTRNGDPLAAPGREYACGPDHHAWVSEPAYRTVHTRLDRDFGPASTHPCAVCAGRADQWSYDHNDPDERIGVVTGGFEVPYSIKPEHYRALCHACHRRVDLHSLKVVV